MNEDRKYIIRIAIVLVAVIFLIKLFSIQVLDDNYKAAAESNIIQTVTEYPYRGLIFDRNGKLLVYNEPIYDLDAVPKELYIKDTMVLSNMLGVTYEELVTNLNKARRYSSIQPTTIVKQLPNQVFAQVQDQLVEYDGIYPKARTIRGYQYPSLANAFGYIGEVSKHQLDRDTTNYYKSGDYMGINGLESSYERFLRGKRGVKYKMVNVRRVEKGSFKDGELDTLAVPGENLTLSIDIDLQTYAEKLMKGKIGSVVAIEPSTGEILAFVSAPTYNPADLAGRKFSENFKKLSTDSLKPLFNRPLMAMYPPGSIFKIVQGLIALEEGVVGAYDQVYCDGSLIGDHAPPGFYDMRRGIMLSSNNYFVKIFRMIINQYPELSQFEQAPLGLANWREQVGRFGLGQTLGVDIPNEKSGFMPDPGYYNRAYGTGRWKVSNLASLSIGQGEILMNPIQMTNLAAIMANRGYYYRPHMVKAIGESNYLLPEYRERIETGISAEHFPVIIQGMADALGGTASRAIISDIEICGKTGTVENPHGEDHSVFMAFAPKDDPKIAISVFVENAGWGGRAAASTASLLIETYLKGKQTRQWLEDYVLAGDFRDHKRKAVDVPAPALVDSVGTDNQILETETE
ncbi:penicillin-binding transpeptidase domain-containing protein [Reichenbachiella carrageenanivorans]|uniref:Penicillin-binding transpeptidase domain-containing protein n=1 Tax=Reichenbachiella carrageenanivorans TaxID=2979869 RepID=A0ABY6D248_9BACT|nr:penicillin-binding transpeptidase domain-containing protein [Reichenbachiella carrageenanivorans]UXX80211.1 penicillin-binding transpeptidase domain-containing protein [Reichenbachiella carrageenanivorans]